MRKSERAAREYQQLVQTSRLPGVAPAEAAAPAPESKP
jgi:hypothetical protein